ncbi:MAG: hypothetical protein L3J25_08920 [Flavobacteriaceae bacterium]|nr:hypothetical protein [Flavobacteriaceae bacterium]
MNEILNNPWITGIGGGIISSLIVYFVTRYAFNKKEKKEYNQKIETANNEILYAVRPLIIEKKIPSDEIFTSIRLSTAKKYGVQPEDLYSEYSISNDLINEIMNNSFLSSDQKIELSELLNTMKHPKAELDKEKNIEIVYVKERDGLSSKYNSILLAMVSFAMVLTMTVYISVKSNELNNSELLKDNLPVFLLATIIPLVAITMLYTLRMIREKDKVREIKKKSKKEDSEDNE